MTPAEQAKRQRIRDFHRTFTREEGIRVLDHLKIQFGYELSSVIPGPDGKVDPYVTHHKEGQKDAIRFIVQILKQLPLDDTEPDPQHPTVKT